MRAYDHTHGLAIESTFRDAPLYVNDGDPSGESAFEVRNGDVIARKTLRGRCLNVRTARVHEHLYAQQIEGASANFAGITAHDISAMHVNADGVETRALIAQQAYVDELHVHHETRTRVLRVDETVVARDVHATNVAATDTVAASIVQGTHVIAETLSAPRQGVLHVTSDLVVHEKASVGSLVARDVIEVLGNARNMRMFEGEIYINNQRTISLNEGRVHAPLVTTAQLMADRIISSLVRLHTLEAGGGHDTGDIDVRARGLTLGNVRIDGDAFIEVVGSDDHNGILEFIAKNGVLMRSGDEELGSFEPPLWQVIKGQGVRQTGSLYMITPGTGRYVKLEPPSTTNEVFSVYVNTQGQSIIALETDPEQTRIPLKLLVGSSLVDEGCGDGSGTSTPSAALQVRSASTYGGPTAVFHVTNPCADAEIKIKAESNTSILSLETATGHVRVEHRSEANELAFFNDETGNDFLVVDTVTGLARVTGDLVVGGSLYFGAATETTSNNGNGQISFDQGLSVTSGLLDLGNVELRAMGNTGRILEISASSVNSPILFAPSFAITEPPNGSSQRQFAFNAYVDQIGAVRHIDNGSSAVLSHTVRQPGELAPSSLKLGFSPRTILADSFADVDTAFEANDDGEISLTNGDDFGRVEIKQDRILQQVKFETTRASYSFDQTAEVVGDVRVKQVSDTARYHSLRSTDEGLYVQGTPSFTANTELALTSAIILGDGYPDGVRWRMRVSPSTGELVFEHQHGPGDAWSSKFRMISGV